MEYTIATLGSHSALDVCAGAKQIGFETLVIAQKGREKTYNEYFRSGDKLGCVDDVLILDNYKDILKSSVQKKLQKNHVIFIPNRSFEVYLDFDYDAIEHDFFVPIFGNKKLLRIEERGGAFDQYDLLQAANIRYPRQFSDPKDIDRLCLVKVLEKTREFERAFFLVENYADYQRQVKKKLTDGIFTQKQLEQSVIEEFVLGAQVNFNFFYSPVHNRLELLGTDTRRQTNIEGVLRLPAAYQEEVLKKVTVSYEESGHIAVTVLESMLEQAFAMGERFVKAAKKIVPPGIIGPFALQAIITPGPPKKDIVVIDVSPRMPGSPGISATPYSYYLHGKHMSVGERVALEVKDAIAKRQIQKILT